VLQSSWRDSPGALGKRLPKSSSFVPFTLKLPRHINGKNPHDGC